MSSNGEQKFRFRFGLRGLLIALLVLGVGFGLLGRLFRQNPRAFVVVVGVLSTIVPYVLAVGTILWLGARRRQSGLLLWGVSLIVVPAIGFGVLAATQRFVGNSPGNLGVLSNQQLIDERLAKQVDQPWVWNELEGRLKSGRLSQAEAEAAVRQLIVHMKSTRPEGWDQPLSWQRTFLASVKQQGLLSDAVLFELADAFYGADPLVQALPRLREGNAEFEMVLEYGSTWSHHSHAVPSLLWNVDRVLLDGTPIKLEPEQKHSKRWSGHYQGTLAAGEHELTFEVTSAYVDRGKLIGLDVDRLPPDRWPNTAEKRQHKISAPLHVFPVNQSLVKMTTDPKLDPRGAISVKRCVVQAYQENQKKIIVELDITPALSIPISFDVDITFGGRTVLLGSRWVAPVENGRSSGGTGLQQVLESLGPLVEYADITLIPAPQHIEDRPEIEEIWGKPITIHDVRIERLDLEVEPTNE